MDITAAVICGWVYAVVWAGDDNACGMLFIQSGAGMDDAS
jgi:hypothetical protein